MPPNKKKKASKIRRMQKRAEKRGETYVPPPVVVQVEEPTHDDDAKRSEEPAVEEAGPLNDSVATAEESVQDDSPPNPGKDRDDGADSKKRKIAAKLQKELTTIDADTSMKAKERRSAKRKAEAIATEQSGCGSAEELLEWYDKLQQESENNESGHKKQKTVPYILFIGQLSYTTTKDQIREYFLAHIKKHSLDAVPANPIVSIRLLTDAKTGKSRGMAFIEVDSVDTLFLLLQLHQTHFDGRRINVERTAGSGKARKKQQLQQLATQRTTATQTTVDNMWKEFQLQQYDDVLDAGVKALCTRHSSTVVRASLERFVETNGHERDNPSAYLTALVGKLATEGIFEKHELQQKRGGGGSSGFRGRGDPKRGVVGHSSYRPGGPPKRQRR